MNKFNIYLYKIKIMAEKIVLNIEEIEALKAIQNEENLIALEIGKIEIQINSLKNYKIQVLNGKLGNLKEKQEQLGNQLNQKYGDGVIDIKTGEFIKNQ